ncbi:MAG TPA: hypothetical protein VGG33_08460, partial [Polyangia bacterium]
MTFAAFWRPRLREREGGGGGRSAARRPLTGKSRLPLLAVGLVVAAAGGAHAQPGRTPVDPLGGYLAELERTGRLPAEVATLPRLRERLAEAEERLIQGDARAAAAGLFALVEAPRFAAFADTVPFQNAELMLGRALLRGGATLS